MGRCLAGACLLAHLCDKLLDECGRSEGTPLSIRANMDTSKNDKQSEGSDTFSHVCMLPFLVDLDQTRKKIERKVFCFICDQLGLFIYGRECCCCCLLTDCID